jgi:hypothetical protein
VGTYDCATASVYAFRSSSLITLRLNSTILWAIVCGATHSYKKAGRDKAAFNRTMLLVVVVVVASFSSDEKVDASTRAALTLENHHQCKLTYHGVSSPA